MTPESQIIINLIPIQDLSKIDVGIFMSAPIHYFSFAPHKIVLQSLDSFDQYSCPRNANLIIGGGSILGGKDIKIEEQTEEYINKKSDEFINNKNPNYFPEYRIKKILRLFRYFSGKKILWGIGDLTEEHFKFPIYKQIYKEATLIGIRNYPPINQPQLNQKIYYIPDVSCCHKLLLNITSQQEDSNQILYIGKLSGNWRKKYKETKFNNFNNFNNIDESNNKEIYKIINIRNTSFETIINEIQISKKIITNSYYVYYWCSLIDKPVELDIDNKSPFQLEFNSFDKSLKHDKAIELNNEFYKKIMDLIK
jgi:hypothetical protein